MTRTIVKAVIGGLVVGTMAFFAPKVLLCLFLFCLLVSAFHCCGRHHCGRHHRFGSRKMLYLADRIRKMNDEEYEEFKSVFGDDCCSTGHRHGHCCSSDDDCCSGKKKNESSKTESHA